MQTHLLSENERKILLAYMADNKTSDTFRVLRFRIKHNFSTIEKDYILLKDFLEYEFKKNQS